MANDQSVFECTVMTWDEMQSLTKNLALNVENSDFRPDVVVALARGGWVPSRCFCDILEVDNLTSMKMEHYTGTAEKGEEPVVRYEVSEKAIKGKDVLIIDDIADTGETVEKAVQHLKDAGASEVQSGLLQELPSSEVEPDFVAETLERFVWVIYPWNIVEDIHNIASKISETGQYDTEVILAELKQDYSMTDTDIESLPFSVQEVFEILEERGEVVRRTGTIFEEP